MYTYRAARARKLIRSRIRYKHRCVIIACIILHGYIDARITYRYTRTLLTRESKTSIGGRYSNYKASYMEMLASPRIWSSMHYTATRACTYSQIPCCCCRRRERSLNLRPSEFKVSSSAQSESLELTAHSGLLIKIMFCIENRE